MSYKLNIYTAYLVLQQKKYEKAIAETCGGSCQVVIGGAMVEHAYKSSEDRQSWKKKSVAYGSFEEDLYEELLSNTT